MSILNLIIIGVVAWILIQSIQRKKDNGGSGVDYLYAMGQLLRSTSGYSGTVVNRRLDSISGKQYQLSGSVAWWQESLLMAA